MEGQGHIVKVFLGSSGEQRKLVEWLVRFIGENFAGKIEPIPWTSSWTGGEFLLENLLTFIETTDASILFWTPDDKTDYRGKTRHEPRDNLVFEAGLFMAIHGRNRTRIVIPTFASGDARSAAAAPTDLQGLTYHSFHWNDNLHASGLAAVAREICEDLLRLGPRPRKKATIVDTLEIQRDSIEVATVAVGSWATINTQAIQRLAGGSNAKQIDILASYRVGDIRRVLGEFRRRKGCRLRACFADMWDEELLAVYQRKFYNRDKKHIQDAVISSITDLLGICTVERESSNSLIIKDLMEPPVANYEIYLTRQRITFGYYRIDDNAFVCPLDMKKQQDPAPPVWGLPREVAPRAFDRYSSEYEAVISEATNVFRG